MPDTEGKVDDRTETARRGLEPEDVRRRMEAGRVNRVPPPPSRSTAEIVKANLFTRFNILLFILLLITLIVLREPRDALFGIVLVSNAAIGVYQELRAKRTLDRLELLAAPRVRVVRSGRLTELAVDRVVVDDVVDLRPGDQLVVDGEVLVSHGLEIDEALLTGESDPVAKEPGDECLSGSFVSAGRGRFRATRVGPEAYAAKLAHEAKRFSLVRSELRDGINWIIGAVSWAAGPMIALLVWSQVRGGDEFLVALRGAVAGAVAMIPQGLVLLTSMALAIGVIRLGRRNVLVQELPAIEGLARVDTVCFDKTGTLTEGRMVVQEVTSMDGIDAGPALAALAASEPNPNATLAAVGAMFSDSPGWQPLNTVPFSSARKWSGATFPGHGTWVLGAPEVVAPDDPDVAEVANAASALGQRVLLAAVGEKPLSGERLPDDLRPAVMLALGDPIRSDAADTLWYLADQGVSVKVISGDNPRTVAAIARQVGVVVDDGGVVDARDLPQDPRRLASVMESATVFGRVTPHQKRAMVAALQSRGHVVAMTGDGVNDVLALKDSDIGLAVGNGAPASRAVAQLVLIDGRFATVPAIVGEGRRVTSNIERVGNLFLTATMYAIGLALAIIVTTLPFPFLPRHLTLVGSLTVGIPSFFLALAPSAVRARPGFVARMLKFAVPTGLTATVATFAGYQIAISEGVSLVEARTTATLILTAIGLFALGIVSRPLVPWKRVLVASMVLLLVLAVLNPTSAELFEVDLPRPVVLLAALGIVAITGTVMIFALRALGWARAMPAILREVEPDTWRDLPQRITQLSGWHRSFPSGEGRDSRPGRRGQR
ncbi:MAG: HAD-IC family P-type ATPase [Actinomycetota bacterium]